jgi:hypothetical protein
MPVQRTIPYQSGTFFITFTCHQWLPLIDKTNGYDIVYNWFNHLKSKGHFINGYVINSRQRLFAVLLLPGNVSKSNVSHPDNLKISSNRLFA